nr:udp-glycosyltransferase 85a3 [Quercus suber]
MQFTITVAQELGIPNVIFFIIAACSLMGFMQIPHLKDKGIIPLKDQQTNCKYACNDWCIGMEIDNDVKREDVEKIVRELMEREKGKKMKKKLMEWKKLAEEATEPLVLSSINLNNLVNEVHLSKG